MNKPEEIVDPPKQLEPARDAADYAAAVEDVRATVLEAYSELAGRMPMFVQFGPGTTDHPGMHLARLWVSLPENAPTNCLIRADTAEELRELLPPGLVFLSRSPGDDPNIVGTWL